MYNPGDRERVFFFVRCGTVKTGTMTDNRLEIIYNIRKDWRRRGRTVAASGLPAGIAPWRSKRSGLSGRIHREQADHTGDV
jgi:hypothetical protein